MRWLDSLTVSMDMNLSKLWETVKDRKAWQPAIHWLKRVRQDLVTEQQHSKDEDFLHVSVVQNSPANEEMQETWV